MQRRTNWPKTAPCGADAEQGKEIMTTPNDEKPASAQTALNGGLDGWLEINLPFGSVYGHGIGELDSFSKRGLNAPGVLIRMQDGAEYLIGHINTLRGVCDDCAEFMPTEIVIAYKIVWTPA